MNTSRNEPCPCGSGKKYKKCCEAKAAVRQQVPQAELNQLVALFHANRFIELENQARLLLERYPDSGQAWKILGTALGIQGKNALLALQQAARLLPRDVEVQNNLGNVFKNLGQFDAAVESYRRALAIKADDAQLHYNLASMLQRIGHLDASAEAYRKALALNPGYVEAHNNLGNVLQSLKQYDAAAASFQRALALNPNFAVAHGNLGNALHDLGRLEEAVVSHRRALALAPNLAEVHYNLGNALQELGQLEAAAEAYHHAIKIKPDYADAHLNLGNALKYLGQFDTALTSYRQTLALDPHFYKAHSNILFVLNFTTTHASSCLEEARQYGRMVAQQAEPFLAWRCKPAPERLRVGLLSGDLCNHPVGYALESLLEQLDPVRIELIAYATNAKTDEITDRLQPHFSAWQPIYGKNDQDAAQLIHADGVHILLDLSGHTAHNRLPVFAFKPAPVQASWLGYFSTTGVAEMDYLLTSEVAVPQAHRGHFTENVWYLPDTWLCFTPPQLELSVNALPALSNGYLTFGCFQRLDKISDAVLSSWRKILAALPNARLHLASKQLSSQEMMARFMQRLQQHEIDPVRVQLQGAAESRADYLARYNTVDVMLDTFPYPGVTTTCEALWLGVPTLTLAGETLLSRQGAGMLVPAGLSDWVATNEDEYVAKAIQLTNDLPKLAALRAGLRAQVLASPVFDAQHFARNFEAALWGMWREKGLEIMKSEPM